MGKQGRYTRLLRRGLIAAALLFIYFLPDGLRHLVMLSLLALFLLVLLIRKALTIASWNLAWKRFVHSIRWRFILLFIVSFILAVATTIMLLVIAVFLSNYDPFHSVLRLISRNGLDLPALVLTGLFCFILFYALLSSRVSNYLAEISLALRAIAGGDLDVYVAKRGEDEVGELAENVNNMAARLRAAMAEERRLEEAKNQLIAGVSHDLRTPLTSIIGYLELVVQQQYANESEMAQYLSISHQKALRLQVLINELFEYTRLNFAGRVQNRSRISLNDLLQQLVEEWTWQFEQAQMEARLSLPSKKLQVSADGNLLVRVFENLLSNGVQYGHQGRYLDLLLRAEPREAVIEVISYGQVIPEADWEQVFVSFYRVDESRSQQGGGSGLGLAIAKQIVELHGGSINVHSTEVEGTIFAVRLPLLDT